MEAEGSDGRRRGKTVRQWTDQQPTAAATEAPACSFIFNRAFQRDLLRGLRAEDWAESKCSTKLPESSKEFWNISL